MLEKGALRAVEFNPSELVFAPWTIMKCKFGCPTYGHNRCCPPFTPGMAEMKEIALSYTRGLMFAVDSMDKGTPLAVDTVNELFREGFYKALAFGTGPCRKCEVCKIGECPHPWVTAPSMEACGMDVFASALRQGFDVHSYNAPGQTPLCIGMILLE